METKFKPEAIREFEEIASHYPVRRAALLPALWLAQREFGWLSPEVLEATAALVGVSPAQVLEVAEFYTMYFKKKPGKYHLQICRTFVCMMNGADQIRKVIEEKLKLKDGETTPNGQFSYQHVECLASCHTGPCMRVNDEYHEGLTPEGVEKLIEKLKTS
jgi:NADH-quinone oxidoreductase E subunit